MTAHYVIFIKNRLLSEISHEARDGISGSRPPRRSVLGHCQHQRTESTESNGYSLQLLGSRRFCPHKCSFKLNYRAVSHVTHLGELPLPDCCSRADLFTILVAQLNVFTFYFYLGFNLLTLQNRDKFPQQTGWKI